jgi:hypothetical protein
MSGAGLLRLNVRELDHLRPALGLVPDAKSPLPVLALEDAIDLAGSLPVLVDRRRRLVPTCLQDGAGGDCLEAARVSLSIGPLAGLVEVQEPGGARGEAGGGRGLVPMKTWAKMEETE